MSFLAPFYLAGLLAISLPLVFHLIRRTPRGRTVFSSLMFLQPSPPRLTRRSRLDQLLLLLLRALILTLLALGSFIDQQKGFIQLIAPQPVIAQFGLEVVHQFGTIIFHISGLLVVDFGLVFL